MKHIVPLIVASFMLAIAAAMLQDDPFTLPYLVGFLLGIVVPVVVYTGTLTLVMAGIYRLYTSKEMPNLATTMWIIWALVSAVIFFGSYQNQQLLQAQQKTDPYGDWPQQKTLLEWQQADEYPNRASAILVLQARFVRDSRQLDAELATQVSTVSIPPLFDPAFLKDKLNFPSAVIQLEDYAQLFQQHKSTRQQMVSRMKIEIEQLDLPQVEIEQAVQEFNNTYLLDSQLSEKYFDIVIEVSQQGIAFLNFLQNTHYRVASGQAVFETNNDTEQYQVYLQAFKRLSQQEVIIQRELTESRERRMARLRELSR